MGLKAWNGGLSHRVAEGGGRFFIGAQEKLGDGLRISTQELLVFLFRESLDLQALVLRDHR